MPQAQDDSPRSAHPIGQLCLEALVKGEAEDLDLGAEGSKKLRAELSKHFDQPDLLPAVEELVIFAWWLSEKQSCPKAADKVIKIAEAAIPALQKRGVDAKALLAGDSIDKTQRAAAAELLASPLRQGPDPRLRNVPDEHKNPGGVLGLFKKK
ncbi:MAG: hypothetical protein ABIJ09_25015 [Pseudomonadota bacterium]